MALSFSRTTRYLSRILRDGPRLLTVRCQCTKAGDSQPNSFDESMLEYLVCPLSKKPLRYDPESNELISDAIGVAFPIVNGVPNLVPQDGRVLNGGTAEKQEPDK